MRRGSRTNKTNNRQLILVGVCVSALGLLLVCVLLIRFYPYTYTLTRFPRLTHTASGVAGDPINVILIGSQGQIAQSFQRAGWLVPDPITPQTAARIASDSLAHRSYPTAPVSNLYVFGHAQDLAFEKPTHDVQNRGHVRLWKTPTHMGGEQVWIGQASYDSGIELSSSTHFPTHHILPTVDVERRSVGADLQATGLVASEAEVAYATPIFGAHNGGGDFYESDGDALVVNLTQIPLHLSPSVWLISGLKTGLFLLYDALLSVASNPGAQVALLVILVTGFVITGGVVLWRLRHRGLPT